MTYPTSIEGGVAVVHLSGRLTHQAHGDIRAKVLHLVERAGVSSIALDLSGVAYMDSSTLGLFLLFKEKGDAAGKRFTFRAPSPSVRSVLGILNFHELFTIEG